MQKAHLPKIMFYVFVLFQAGLMFVPRLIYAHLEEEVVLDNMVTYDVFLNIIGPLTAIVLLTIGYFVPKFFKNQKNPDQIFFMIFMIKFAVLEAVGFVGFFSAMITQIYQVAYPYAVIAIVVMMFNYPSEKRREFWLEDAGFEAH